MVMYKTADQSWPPIQAKKIGNKLAVTPATPTSKVVLQSFLDAVGPTLCCSCHRPDLSNQIKCYLYLLVNRPTVITFCTFLLK